MGCRHARCERDPVQLTGQNAFDPVTDKQARVFGAPENLNYNAELRLLRR